MGTETVVAELLIEPGGDSDTQSRRRPACR